MFANETITSPLTVDKDNVVRIGKTRVTLDTLIASFDMGATPEEIVQQYPVLALVDVYATIAYYLQNRVEVDAYLDQRKQEAAQIRQANEIPGIRARLIARRMRQD